MNDITEAMLREQEIVTLTLERDNALLAVTRLEQDLASLQQLQQETYRLAQRYRAERDAERDTAYDLAGEGPA